MEKTMKSGRGDTAGKGWQCSVIGRAMKDDPFGRRRCYDLKIEEDGETVILEDVASSLRLARKIARFFSENRVAPCHASDVYEDLAADPSFID